MDAIKCIKQRRSIRSYQDKEIPKEIIEDIIDCARLAPTARNIQPWEFLAITDKETLAKIADLTDYGMFIKDCGCCVIVICKDDAKYYIEDGSSATQNIMLAAYAHNLGSCWVAGDKKDYCEPTKKLLGIPANFKVMSFIPIGYPIAEPPPPSKRELKEVLHWEKF